MDSCNEVCNESSGHRCTRRNDDRGGWNAFLNWWILPVHFVIVSIITIVTLKVLQGRSFLVDSNETNEYSLSASRIYQSDVNTLLSVALVLVRTLASYWLTLTGWRMAFIALERNEANLREIGRMVSYRLPSFALWGSNGSGGASLWAVAGTMWIIFMLALPNQFSAPLLTGAINWIPETGYIQSRSPTSITTPSPNAPQWIGHNMWQNNRFYEVLSASGLASLTSPTSFTYNQSTPYHAPSRRFIPSLLEAPVHSKVKNVTMPYFQIHSLDWITSANQLVDEIEKLQRIIRDSDAPALKYSSLVFNNAFSFGTDAARLVLVNEVPWAPVVQDNVTYSWPFPPATVQTAVKWVIVATQFKDNCTAGWPPAFGPRSDLYTYNDLLPHPGCYVFARINYTAGAMVCHGCSVVLNGTVEGPTLGLPIPHPLVSDAISMIPEVLFFMKVSNASQAPTWQNIDGYTRGMISTAYQASWNSLANSAQFSPMDETEISTPYPVLVARIITWRVLAWFGLNLMLSLSGVLLAILQKSCQNKTIRNPVLAAIMLDTSAILGRDSDGLCNSVSLQKGDDSLRLRIKLSKKYENYEHPRIEIAEVRSGPKDSDLCLESSSRRRSKNSTTFPTVDTVSLL